MIDPVIQTLIDPVIQTLVETELALQAEFNKREVHKRMPFQIKPEGDNWEVWAAIAGRGAGKTELGAMETVEHCREFGYSARATILAPTISDAREVCIEGPSGLLTLFGNEFSSYHKTNLILRHKSGGIVRAFGAEKPERLRGPQGTFLWVDEFAIIGREAIENALFGLRLGENPWMLITSTPRPTTHLKEVLADERTVITKATTYDNPNLSAKAVAKYKRNFAGTRLGRQELLAEILEEAEGALWKMKTIEDNRIAIDKLPEFVRTVVAIDPATTKTKKSDFTGISVASKGESGNYYHRFSVGLKVAPHVWARRAIDLYHEFDADLIVAEKNQGGDMVEETLQVEWPDAPIKLIHASKGKRVRAEPVATLAEKGKIKFVGSWPSLEDQLINFGYTVEPENDDELDAHVYAITELMEEEEVILFRRLGS